MLAWRHSIFEGRQYRMPPCLRMNLLVQSRHKPLTEWITACYDSGAFSEKFLRALFFCSVTKMLKAPSGDGAFLV